MITPVTPVSVFNLMVRKESVPEAEIPDKGRLAELEEKAFIWRLEEFPVGNFTLKARVKLS